MKKYNDYIICRCEEVSKEEIEEAIKDENINTIDGVKRATRASMGLCQGKTCQHLIRHILKEKTGNSIENIKPPTVRPPFRPVKMNLLANFGKKILLETGEASD